jgi:enoyl-CoA hydratase/carnithine racemase
MGLGPALEFMYTGDLVDAQRALELGLVNRVVPHDELLPRCRELAARIAAGPSLAIEFIKKIAFRTFEGDSIESITAYEAFAQSVCEASEDGAEGVRSFQEKREPSFRGR